MNHKPVISISIVSHQQGALVAALLSDIAAHCAIPLEIILTLNVPEPLAVDPGTYPFPVKIIRNTTPKGFGANHNAVFANVNGRYFCVLNPDIRVDRDPFPVLTPALEEAGVVAPLVVGPEGLIEDSARRFPTPVDILKKFFKGPSGPDYAITSDLVEPDWIAGMFMLWRAEVFRQLGGFDEGFFLYYEDVDICARLRQMGHRVLLIPAVRVTHHARRASHSNLRYLRWHAVSMMRYFCKAFVRHWFHKVKY